MPQTTSNSTTNTTTNVVTENQQQSSTRSGSSPSVPSIRTLPEPVTSVLGSLIGTNPSVLTTGPMPVPRTSPSSTNNGSVHHQIHVRPSLLQGTTSAGVLGSATTPLMSPAEASAPASNKILGRNVNGTLVMTSAPSNEAELQLYRVMQRASLLAYYDTLLEMGGDDVQQLCEAGEEEFLEIMALVGMASKPLHVRRLQKALQEWVSNPAMFQAPVLPGLPPPGGSSSGAGGSPIFPSSVSSASSSSSLHELPSSRGVAVNLSQQPPPPPPPISHSPAPPSHASPGHQVISRPSPPTTATNGGSVPVVGSRHGSPSPGPGPPLQGPGSSHGGSSGGAPSPGLPLHVHGADSLSPGSPPPLQLTPTLSESQITRLAESARLLAASLPSLEPKPQNSKKRICKDLEFVMSMAEDDPRRMEEIRKYAAIYGRFDCKRKPEKPLTLHEVSVNEAAAQICRLVPALLTRRDELFPLARQVVRDSGYQYSKTHASESGHSLGCPSGYSTRPHNGEDAGSSSSVISVSKRIRLDPSEPHTDLRRQERLEQISEELRAVAERQEELRRLATTGGNAAGSAEAAWHTQLEALAARHAQLAGEQAELGRSAVARHSHSTRGYRRSTRISAASYGDAEQRAADTDDTDSQFSYSNASSPSQDIGDSRDSTTREGELTATKSPNKVSKQLVHETLLGEGLRVVKELVASQTGEEPPDPPHPVHLGHVGTARGLLHHYDAFFHHENKVQVIAASGGNIIAVANPALSMSPAMLQSTESAIEVKGQCSPRPHSATATSHPITSLLQGLTASQFKQEPLSPCKSE